MPSLSPRRSAFALLARLALVVTPALAIAQPGGPARSPYTATAAKQVVDSMATLLRARYADADTGAMIAAHIQRRLADGAYARVTDWAQFVRLLTQDLQAVNEDTHLFVDVAAGGGGPGAPGGPGGPGGPGRPDHGVAEVERLPGNVGYLRMVNFLGADAAAQALEGAFRILAPTDAIIIDLRNSRGGSPMVANFIISHFVDPDTSAQLIVYDRVRGTTTPRYTMREVPGPRRPDVPLYVLVDDVTRSAAEDLPFVLQNMKRATIVGSRTAGAGRNNMGFALGHGISGSVSFTRVMEPGTRREWEHRGVVPDVAAHPDSALAVAHLAAVRRVLEARSGPARAALEQALAGIEASYAFEARAAAARRPAADLQRLVGTYEGGQTLVVDGDRLVYQPRVAQPREVLTPLADGTFAAGDVRFRVTVEGGAATLVITTADGSSSSYRRTSPSVAPRRR